MPRSIPNHVFVNANVVTMDPDRPRAEAFWVFGDKFVSVGTTDDVRAAAPPDARETDLGGRTVVPGFIETHNHLSYHSLTLSHVDCSPYANRNIDELKARLKAAAEKQPPGEWIEGWGYDDTMLEGARHLTRKDLDEAVPHHPVQVLQVSGHILYTNSLGLAIGGITRDTPQPAGGSFDVDADGEPTGVLREHSAIWMIHRHLAQPDTATFEAALPEAAALYNREGVTSIHDGMVGFMGQGVPILQAYQNLADRGALSLRVYLTTHYTFYENYLASGIRQGFGSDFLRLGAIKFFQDGSIQILTAALADDYHCQKGFRGPLVWPQEEIDARIARAHQQGLQIACHANGDGAIESVIGAFERAQEKYPQPVRRHMIIHCQMATDDHIKRMKHLGIVPSYFPNHVYYWGDRHENRFIGPERAARIDPLGSSTRAGLRFTLHSDAPVTPVSPLHSMHCAVNRVTRNGKLLGGDERITPYEALKAFTVDAAYCSFEEDIKGSITRGRLADFAVLSDDPMTVDPMTIRNIEVLATYVGGRTVYPNES